MANLRSIIDGQGSLQLNLPTIALKDRFKVQDDVLIRKQTNRSGPLTQEVIVGRILAMGEGTADLSITRPGGVTKRVTVNLRELSPVTDSFRRKSVQFNTQFRQRF